MIALFGGGSLFWFLTQGRSTGFWQSTMFPPFHAPQNETEFNAFVTSLENSRQASLDMPITFPSALRPLRECVNPEPPVGSEPLLPETCRIPAIFLPDVRPRFLPESRPLTDTTLVVTEPLLIGVNQLSQTYHGRVNCRGYESVEVVVKLFQQSLFRYPYLEDSFDRFSQSDWVSATELAQREAWAYDKMIVLQGTTIPHSYGFYMVSIVLRKHGGTLVTFQSSAFRAEKKLSAM
jgi:hypothetical protein